MCQHLAGDVPTSVSEPRLTPNPIDAVRPCSPSVHALRCRRLHRSRRLAGAAASSPVDRCPSRPISPAAPDQVPSRPRDRSLGGGSCLLASSLSPLLQASVRRAADVCCSVGGVGPPRRCRQNRRLCRLIMPPELSIMLPIMLGKMSIMLNYAQNFLDYAPDYAR